MAILCLPLIGDRVPDVCCGVTSNTWSFAGWYTLVSSIAKARMRLASSEGTLLVGWTEAGTGTLPKLSLPRWKRRGLLNV